MGKIYLKKIMSGNRPSGSDSCDWCFFNDKLECSKMNCVLERCYYIQIHPTTEEAAIINERHAKRHANRTKEATC